MVSFYGLEAFKQVSDTLELASIKQKRPPNVQFSALTDPKALQVSGLKPKEQHRQALRNWFNSLSLTQRRTSLSIHDPQFAAVLLQMFHKHEELGGMLIYYKYNLSQCVGFSNLFNWKRKKLAEAERELQEHIRITDTCVYLDTVTLDYSLLNNPDKLFSLMNELSSAQAFRVPCREHEFPPWLYTCRTLTAWVCLAVEKALWSSYWAHIKRTDIPETGYLNTNEVWDRTSEELRAELKNPEKLDALGLSSLQEAGTPQDIDKRKTLVKIVQNFESSKFIELETYFADEKPKKRRNYVKQVSSTSSSSNTPEDTSFISDIIQEIISKSLDKIKPVYPNISENFKQVTKRKKQKKSNKKLKKSPKKTIQQPFPIPRNTENRPTPKVISFQLKPAISTSEIDFPPLSSTDNLHSEIQDYVKKELAKVSKKCSAICLAIDQLRLLLSVAIPGCQVYLFGSYATGLALDSSDVDLEISHPAYFNREIIQMGCSYVTEHLTRQHWLRNLQCIPYATIPLVKAEVNLGAFSNNPSHGHIDIDISFYDFGASHHGANSTKYIKYLLDTHPSLLNLTIVLKSLLCINGLNSSYKGGFGSYSLVIMITAWLKEQKSEDLGELLLGFLEFYGTRFDPTKTGINIANEGSFFPLNGNDGVVILDPVSSSNTTRSSYNAKKVFQLFAGCFTTLQYLKNAGKTRDLLNAILKYNK